MWWRSGAVGFWVALLMFAGSDEGNVLLLSFLLFFIEKNRDSRLSFTKKIDKNIYEKENAVAFQSYT